MSKTIYRAEYRRLLDVLRERRMTQGLSQASVAGALGWRQQKLSASESGARRLDVLEFIELASVLQLSPARALDLAAHHMRDIRKRNRKS
jgi:transcriptional regulator with XRE-family HTH domain